MDGSVGLGSTEALFVASGTNALHNIFGFLWLETFGKWHTGYGDVIQAISAVATHTRQVHVPQAMAGVVVVTHTVLLGTTAVVYLVKQVSFGQAH